MKTDPIGLLSSLLLHSGHEVVAHQFASTEALTPFIDAGWLVPAGVPDVVPCEVCDDVHLADVVDLGDKPRGICRRTADTFAVSSTSAMHRVDGDAVARSLAQALRLDGATRRLRGFEAVWKLGGRRLDDTRVALFFTPDLDRLDAATSILEAVAEQSRAMTSGLIVASDIDQVRLLQARLRVIRLCGIITVESNGQLAVDEKQLLTEIFPETAGPRARGRRPDKGN